MESKIMKYLILLMLMIVGCINDSDSDSEDEVYVTPQKVCRDVVTVETCTVTHYSSSSVVKSCSENMSMDRCLSNSKRFFENKQKTVNCVSCKSQYMTCHQETVVEEECTYE